MTATARLLEQRSVGHVHLRVERDGIAVMREAGSSKCRCPSGTREAILINTSGGLAGGDSVGIKAEVGAGARLTLTSQAAERIYRTLGPAANVQIHLSAAADSSLLWLPQENIFFDGSALSRSMHVALAESATFLAVEALVFGRTEMGETVKQVSVVDRWNIRCGGKLIHAEALRLGPVWPGSRTGFAGNQATATVLLISPQADVVLEHVRGVLGPDDGISAWNGKLVVRLLAKDGFNLRKILTQVLVACVGREHLPRCWTF